VPLKCINNSCVFVRIIVIRELIQGANIPLQLHPDKKKKSLAFFISKDLKHFPEF
jgi:hypothetical protein